MKPNEKLYTLHRLLHTCKYPISLEKILTELNCSKPTFHRLRHDLQSLGAPLEYSKRYQGYWYPPESEQFELPGLWFCGLELEALLMVDHFAASLQIDTLQQHLSPLRNRMETLLQQNESKQRPDWRSYIKIVPISSRVVPQKILPLVFQATTSGKRLEFSYRALQSRQPQKRCTSPQCLIRYRDNWYLDAWCHERSALRTFALSRMQDARIDTRAAKRVAARQLQSYFASAYGIFTGPVRQMATVDFTGVAATVVSQEKWHPRQTGKWLDDTHYRLSIPFGEPHELIMDILRWGPLAEVTAPASLRAEVKKRLEETVKKYL